jgi:secondary thiamine-phosphate synthase enzyme
MIVKSFEETVKTSKNFEIIDVTSKVEEFVKNSGVTEGTVTIASKHTTAAIRVNENEPLLFKDIEMHVDSLAPDHGYHHDRIHERKDCPADEPKNAHAHLKALLMGASETLPVMNGKISLGKWQKILFIELDGPRERKYTVVVMGK